MHRLRASAALAFLVAACAPKNDLVVYCSIDQEFVEPILRQYERETGLTVRGEFDIEANKTVGLARRLREESARPRCDVFWNSEPANTVQLGADGLLEAYDSPSAKAVPAQFRDPERRWTGFGARARIFIVNTDLADPRSLTTMWDVVDPKWSGKVGISKPTSGTALTHLAALYAVIGEAKAEEYVRAISDLAKSGAIRVVDGNSIVAQLVGDGKLAFGWADSDDFQVALERGAHVVAVYPDAQGIGTLFFPNTIAIVRGAPHAEAARKFVDWVLRPETERELAFARSAQIPVRADVERPANVIAPGQFKAFDVDFRRIGAEVEKRAAHFQELFVE